MPKAASQYSKLTEEQKEKRRANAMKDYWKHRDKRKARHNSYYYENRERALLKAREYREANKELIKPKAAALRKKNKKKYAASYKRFYESNKTRILKQRTARAKQRVKEDVRFKLRRLLHARLGAAIRQQYGTKAKKTMELIGCTISELRAHLEKQFKPGMSWDNWATKGWHVDHIRGCAQFDLTDPEQQKICFHYTNLQPLWWRDNIIKGAGEWPTA